MPTYEYECSECGRRVELMQRVSDPPLRKCRSCGGSVRKLLFPVGVIYKGSGFYTTDYARKGLNPDDDGDGKRDTKPDGKNAERTRGRTKH